MAPPIRTQAELERPKACPITYPHRAEHHHLHRRGAEQPAAQSAELLEGKLKPDREKEQGDAQLGDEGDVLDVKNKVGHGWADDQSPMM